MPPKEKAKAKAKPVEKKEEKDVPPQPERAKFKQLLDDKSNEVMKIQSELEALKTQLTAKSGEKDEFFEQKAAFAAEIQTYAERIAKLNEQKKGLREGLNKKGDEKKAVFAELKKTENMYQCKDEAEVDERITKIEFELSTTTMSLSDEKRKVQEIQLLKKMKPHVTAAAAKVAHLKSKTEEMKADSHLPVKDQIQQLTQKANEAWEAMEAVKKRREATNTEWESKHGGTKVIEEKRTELIARRQELTLEKTKLREQLREQENVWYRHEQEERRAKQEQRDTERKFKQQEWEQKKLERDAEKITEQPHLAEVAALEQSIQFLKSMLPKEEVEEKKDTAHNFNNPEGSVVLLKKKDREEIFLAASKKKAFHKKAKTNKTNVIKHNAETFRLFDALHVKAPSTTDQIPDTLKELEEQLAKYNARIAEWSRKLADGTLLKEFQEKHVREPEKEVPIEEATA
eukprot:GEMP01022922.1.p1 GENE.GEMP01022922.1~~GEMP01022922.1.p1  ORF type:complete len:458 (+),score=164.89 GEMP01022922.1:74-1447(+)